MKNWFAARCLAVGLSLMVTLVAVTPQAEAMVVPTETAGAMSGLAQAEDMKTVEAFLENKVVRQRLLDLGLSEAEVDSKLSQLSPAQLHQVAMQIDQQIAAGDDDDLWIGLGVGVLLVALIVWIVKALD